MNNLRILEAKLNMSLVPESIKRSLAIYRKLNND